MISIRSSLIRTAIKSCPVVSLSLVLLLSFFIRPITSAAADYPEAEITNGIVTAKMYLPDAENGYYRSTRFDWSGAVYSLQYAGHEFYGPWIDRIDPDIINWEHRGDEIVSGLCSALNGPVEEFVTPLGWDDAETGGTFIKIGVGVLLKSEGRYNQYKHYDVLNPGTWTVKKAHDSVEFTQELSDPSSGYAYTYRKTVRIANGKPEMEIDHSLKNTGRLAINTSVYNHNFVRIDNQGTGPDYTVRMPFEIQQGEGDNRGPAEISGNRIVFPRQLTGKDEIVLFIDGYDDTAKDNELIIENTKVGAGMRITGNRPLIQELLWSIRTVLTIETFVGIDIQPGDEFTWKNIIEYYTLPAGK
ncbi:hypothetical protein ACFL6P_01295 [Candidatus Latescibacterota bacterium]